MMSQINDKGNRSGTEKTEDQPERRVRVTERDTISATLQTVIDFIRDAITEMNKMK
jgi:hypothetical protein